VSRLAAGVSALRIANEERANEKTDAIIQSTRLARVMDHVRVALAGAALALQRITATTRKIDVWAEGK
jgi:hypothetical protein